MPALERSLTDVLQDIIRNVQDIVRSEIRLAKTEIREEATKAKSSTMLLGAGALAAVFAMAFLLLAAVHSLALVMPNWAAGLVVGGTLAVIAMAVLSAGIARFKKIHLTPERTVETIKETFEWTKQQTK